MPYPHPLQWNSPRADAPALKPDRADVESTMAMPMKPPVKRPRTAIGDPPFGSTYRRPGPRAYPTRGFRGYFLAGS
jgi:hypothetical protein